VLFFEEYDCHNALQFLTKILLVVIAVPKHKRNSSGDEIANVNFLTDQPANKNLRVVTSGHVTKMAVTPCDQS